MEEPVTFADKRRVLQLETLHDLALALHAERDEQDLLEELLGRVCLVLDPATAIAVTRDPGGGARAAAVVGWPGREPDGDQLLKTALWSDLLAEGDVLVEVEGRSVAAPGEVLAAILGARSRRQRTMTGKLYRGAEPIVLTVEMPYLPARQSPSPGPSGSPRPPARAATDRASR